MKTRINPKLALTLGAAALATLSGSAEAATYLTVTDGTAVFGNTEVTTPTFTDMFDLGAFGTGMHLISGTISSSYQTGHMAAQNIDFTTVSLNGQEFTIGQTGQFEFRYVADVRSTTPNMLTVSGTSGDTASYSGTLNVAPAAAVPEPASWAMLIGGVGITGGTMRRRRQSARVTFA